MRIALVTRPAMGGIRRHLHTLVTGLQEAGWEPLLLAPQDFMLEGLLVPHYPFPYSNSQNPSAHIQAVLRLTQHLRRHNPAIVHAHGLRAALFTAPAAWRTQIPFVFTLHNLVPRLTPPQRLFLQWAAKRAGRIIAVSQAVAQSAEAIGVPAHHIEVIPNGINPESFLALPSRKEAREQLGLPLDRPIIAAVGRLSREKGFDVLVAAAAQIASAPSQALVVIAGEGPEQEALHQQITSLAAPVKLLGHIPHVEPLYAAADVVVVPSREEGQGIVAIEAMFARKAIVASAVGGLVETLGEGRYGQLVPPDNPTLLAAALLTLLQNSAQCAHSVAAAFQHATASYTAENMLSRHLALYQALQPKKIFH